MPDFAPKISYIVTYEGKNITDDISRYLVALKYKDSTKGKSDELSIELEDADGRWKFTWYPRKKDKMTAEISDGSGSFLPCGTFEIDGIEAGGPPDTLTIDALATAISKKLRTKKFIGHEGKSLKQIAQSICDTHGFTLDEGTHVVTKQKEVQSDIDRIESLKGDLYDLKALEETDEVIAGLQKAGPQVAAIRNDLKKKDLVTEAEMVDEGFRWLAHSHYSLHAINYYINRLVQVQSRLTPYVQKKEKQVVANNLSSIIIERSTQNGETDLGYLNRISEEHGFYFNIKGDMMIFYMLSLLEGQNPKTTLSRSDFSKWNIKDTSVGTGKKARVRSHNPQTNEVITAEATPEPLFQTKNEYRPASFSKLKNDGKSETTGAVDEPSEDDEFQDPSEETAEDELEYTVKAENQQQADAKAKGLLDTANKKAVSGSFTTALNINLVSGNNVKITGIGEMSGIFHIETAEFEITRVGATVTCEVYRVGKVNNSDKKP